MKNGKKSENVFRREKIEICKSSETRVAEVSRRSEPSSRGKRTFEVRFDRFDNSFGSIDNCPAYLGGPLCSCNPDNFLPAKPVVVFLARATNNNN